jgi:hypothetical protein
VSKSSPLLTSNLIPEIASIERSINFVLSSVCRFKIMLLRDLSNVQVTISQKGNMTPKKTITGNKIKIILFPIKSIPLILGTSQNIAKQATNQGNFRSTSFVGVCSTIFMNYLV